MNTKTEDKPKADAEQFDLGTLPSHFPFRQEDGSIIQVAEPCYNLLSAGYYSETYFAEGEIIVTEIVPNYTMQPLNRAAEKAMNEWLNSLPEQGVMITMEDTVEASHMLRNDPRVKDLSHDDFSKAVQRVAMALKRKREEKGGLSMPALTSHTMRVTNTKAAPMPNMRYTDPTQRSPGQTGSGPVLHQPQRGGATTRRMPAMGNMPGAR